MKSQVLRIRNLPSDRIVVHRVHVKPVILMVLFLLGGIVMLFMKPYLLVAALTMILLALFSLFIMPDRVLCEFTEQDLVLYNQTDKTRCFIIYWDEVVSWHYERHPAYDLLVVSLIDGSTQTQEMYSKMSVNSYMNQYAAGKEKKYANTKRTGI